MTFNARRTDFSREHIFVVELDLDNCTRTYGSSPCLAAVGVTGDQRCFNTRASCQYPSAYVATAKTYRHCTARSPHPSGLTAVPDLESVQMSPSVVDLSGGLGVRASVALSFKDHPSSDSGIDPYLSTRSYDPLATGTYWNKLRARSKYYQGRPLRLLSGYLVNGAYDAANFQTRHYVIESIDVSDGSANITAKDPLKLADNNRSQAPKPSTGQLASGITATQTSVSLTPAGVGSAEYPASGFIRVRSEIMGFTRTADALTLTRGRFNTTAAAQSAGDSVQLCLHYESESVDDIISDLLENYAGVDPTFIPATDWADEINDYLPGLLSTLITEPVGVSVLLKELGEQAPHSLFWDERDQEIKLVATKPPGTSSATYTGDSIISLSTTDEREMRISTVFVYFGQIDPTKKLDERDNYAQTYVRADATSIEQYGSTQIKTIFSRWISSVNKAAAVLLASRTGRRFADTPRSITYQVDAKDIGAWSGQTVGITHRDIPGFTGAPALQQFQITSVKELRDRYQYTALEYNYFEDDLIDPGTGLRTIIIGSDVNDLNIRLIHDTLFPPPISTTTVKLVIEAGVTVGSTTPLSAALQTGSWPAGVVIEIENSGKIYGAGGEGKYDAAGGTGGTGVELQHAVSFNNLGTIAGGGGGGGGARSLDEDTGIDLFAGGGGGAGRTGGIGFSSGTDTTGGVGQTITTTTPTLSAIGGTGGALGTAGSAGVGSTLSAAGGAAGLAGKGNGYVVTNIEVGTIIGDVT
jgi:hypothetical protein